MAHRISPLRPDDIEIIMFGYQESGEKIMRVLQQLSQEDSNLVFHCKGNYVDGYLVGLSSLELERGVIVKYPQDFESKDLIFLERYYYAIALRPYDWMNCTLLPEDEDAKKFRDNITSHLEKMLS
jgi:hypothetical protein